MANASNTWGILRAALFSLLCAASLSLALPMLAWADDQAKPSNESEGTADSAIEIDDENAVEIDGETNRVDPTQRADNSFIYDTTIDSLFSQPSLYDGKIVQVSGEAIGDIVVEDPLRRKNCWITLTSIDSANPATISVFMSREQAAQIDHLGRYGVTGSIMQIRGIYHQACPEHEGTPDVHATNTAVISRGLEHPDMFEIGDFVPGAVAVLVGLILMGVYYFIRERSR
jgi:hypothetical protein